MPGHDETIGATFGRHDILVWLTATLVATGIALMHTESVFSPQGIVPFGSDAFYHASRILDAAIGDRGFYQFDEMMHVPEGSWVSWPWAYDLLLAGIVRLQQLLAPGSDPMALLVFVPVAWIGVNSALLLAITLRLGLRIEFRFLSLLGFALLPTTQTQHGIGQVDHHFVELFFVLLSTWTVISWLRAPASLRWAAAIGIILGLAHGFHHALFVLQLPLLLGIGILWIKGLQPPPASLRVLAVSLLLSTLAMAVPSGPVLDMQFSMTTLSWFHVYIASASALVLTALSFRPFSVSLLGGLAALGLVLLLPITADVLRGTDFVTGRMQMLDNILEMTSPLAMMTGDFGFNSTTGVYSLFIVLVPLLIVFSAWQLYRETTPAMIGYFAYATIGMTLMLMQYRLNYFGAAFMLTAPWVVLNYLPNIQTMRRGLVAGGAVVVFLVGFRPALTGPLLATYPIGGNILYETVQPLMEPLQEACEEDPGIVLAHGQFGHAISFHTDCSVIANNFLISDLHFQKVQEVNELFTVPAELLASSGSPIRYVFVMIADTHGVVDGVTVLKRLDDIERRNPRLIRDLMFGAALPAGVEQIAAVEFERGNGQTLQLAAVFRLTAE